ncbi:MAG: hypothetical protein ABFS43_11185 [Thermodesulfobacteriota bacterium]
MQKLAKEAQERYGYTDEQVQQLKENQIKLINNISKLAKYKLIAECGSVCKAENGGF